MRRFVLIAALALIAAACGSAAETIAEQVAENNPGIENFDIDPDTGEATVEFTDDEGGGSLTFGGGEIPDGFPIPIPDGGEILSSASQASLQLVTLTYPIDRYDGLVEFYQDWLDGTDGETGTFTATGASANASFFNADLGFNVLVAKADDQVLVTASVNG